MLTTEERRNAGHTAAAQRDLLIEVGRSTNTRVAAYQEARTAFILAARALSEHADRWVQRRAEFENAGGDVTINPAAEFAQPERPQPVTLEDING